jgi:hypothetical protein
MTEKEKSVQTIHRIPMNMPPPGWKPDHVLTINWHSSDPVAAGGYKSANTNVTCTLAGPNGNSTKPANQTSTSWDVDFGVQPGGHYLLTARGSDNSSFSVSINVT